MIGNRDLNIESNETWLFNVSVVEQEIRNDVFVSCYIR